MLLRLSDPAAVPLHFQSEFARKMNMETGAETKSAKGETHRSEKNSKTFCQLPSYSGLWKASFLKIRGRT